MSLPQWAGERDPSKKTALLFGPEDDDLRREHLEKCTFVVLFRRTRPTRRELALLTALFGRLKTQVSCRR